VPSLGQPLLEYGRRRFGGGHGGVGDLAILGDRAGLPLGQARARRGQHRARIRGLRGRLVERVARRVAVGRQGRGARELLLGVRHVRLRLLDLAAEDRHLLLAHPGIDMVALGARLAGGRARLDHRRGELGIVDPCELVALAHHLAGAHQEEGEPAADLGRDADLGGAHHADRLALGGAPVHHVPGDEAAGREHEPAEQQRALSHF
jgi:hypothetical protein